MVGPRVPPRPRAGDLAAALAVALVLVPQSVAYAALAGLPPQAGLVAAAVSTIAAAPFVSWPLLQTGPTAVTSLLVLGSLAPLAAASGSDPVALAALLALLVGAVRLLVGLRGAGDVAYLVSEPVLLAFTSAAGLVIVLSQVPRLLGTSVPAGSVLGGAVQALVSPDGWTPAALVLGAGAVAFVLLAQRLHPLVPGVLLATVGGVVAVRLLDLRVPVVGELPAVLPRIHLDLPWASVPDLLVPAIVIALVGFSEASAIARQGATRAGVGWDADREFVSQGAANIAAGLVGGMPVGASFSRSEVNRRAGATTAWSGVLAGVLVVAALPFVGLLAALPDAVLAGIVLASVLGLLDPRPLLALRRYSRQQFVLGTVTWVLTLALAPRIQWAVLVGVLLVVGAHLRRERLVEVEHEVVDGVLRLQPIGVLHFGSVQRLEDQLRELLAEHPRAVTVEVDLRRVGRTDVSGALVLRRVLQAAADAGHEVVVTGLAAPSRAVLARVLEDAELGHALPEAARGPSSPWRR